MHAHKKHEEGARVAQTVAWMAVWSSGLIELHVIDDAFSRFKNTSLAARSSTPSYGFVSFVSGSKSIGRDSHEIYTAQLLKSPKLFYITFGHGVMKLVALFSQQPATNLVELMEKFVHLYKYSMNL